MQKLPMALVLTILASSVNLPAYALEETNLINSNEIVAMQEESPQETPQVRANITNTTANAIVEPALVIESVASLNNKMTYSFYGAAQNLRLKSFYLADLEFYYHSVGEADSQIEELGVGVKPGWARYLRQLEVPANNGDIVSKESKVDSYTDFFTDGPGITYYLLEIEDRSGEEPQTYLVRGKIDYYDCAFLNIYEGNKKFCVAGKTEDGNFYTFTRRPGEERDENNPLVAWSERVHKKLDDKIWDFRNAVNSWNGDVATGEALHQESAQIRRAIEDAEPQEDLIAKLDECDAIIDQVEQRRIRAENWKLIEDTDKLIYHWYGDEAVRSQIFANLLKARRVYNEHGDPDNRMIFVTELERVMLRRIQQYENGELYNPDDENNEGDGDGNTNPGGDSEDGDKEEKPGTGTGSQTPAGGNTGGSQIGGSGAGGMGGTSGSTSGSTSGGSISRPTDDAVTNNPASDQADKDQAELKLENRAETTQNPTPVTKDNFNNAVQIAQNDQNSAKNDPTENANASEDSENALEDVSAPELGSTKVEKEKGHTGQIGKIFGFGILGVIIMAGLWWIYRAFIRRREPKP